MDHLRTVTFKVLMPEMIPTPFIDKVLTGEPELSHTAEQYAKAKALIAEAIEQGSMYLVDFKMVKYWMRQAIQVAFEPIMTRHNAAGLGRLLVGKRVHFKNVDARREQLRKYAHVPEIQEHLALLDDVETIGQALKAVQPLLIRGRRPLARLRPLDDTLLGTCPICGELHKLTAERRLMHHGFHIAKEQGQVWGDRVAKCFGCGYEPYERSNEGNMVFKAHLEREKTEKATYLQRLRLGEIKELVRLQQKQVNQAPIIESVRVSKGDFAFEAELKKELRQTESEMAALTSEIERQTKLIQEWNLRPLPGASK